MAQSLTIAKAAFSASLFRADPVSTPRAIVDAFFPLLHSTLTQCSRPNVQKCKAWIVEHVAPSRSRTAALGKYLVALSKSLEQDEGKKPSLRRRRLHVLYITSDALHNVATRLGTDEFADALGEHLPELIACAVDFKNCPKHMQKLQDLVAIWEEKRFFSPTTLAKLQAALSGTQVTPPSEPQSSTTSKPPRDAPYALPSVHGDQSTPWYDLPAGTWLPHLTPNSTRPMIPSMIKPIQLAPGPADKDLADAVSKLLTDVNRIFSKSSSNEEDGATDINELGERVVLDEITGDVIGGETYYGWSRTFCEKMKERKLKAKKGRGRARSPSRSSDYSRDRSRSPSGPPAFKRRRPSSSPNSFRRRNSSRSYSPRRDSRTRSRSYNRARDRSRSRSPYRRRSYSRSPSRSPRRPYSPPVQQRTGQPPQHQPPPPFPFPQGNLAPPPPPAGYTGPWPPPPPPPAPSQGPDMPPIPVAGQWAGGWSSLPHGPPPVPSHQFQQQQHGVPQGHHGSQGHGMGRGSHTRGGQWRGHRGRGRTGYRGRARGWQ